MAIFSSMIFGYLKGIHPLSIAVHIVHQMHGLQATSRSRERIIHYEIIVNSQSTVL